MPRTLFGKSGNDSRFDQRALGSCQARWLHCCGPGIHCNDFVQKRRAVTISCALHRCLEDGMEREENRIEEITKLGSL